MKILLGWLLIVLGIAIGLYVGVWFCFIGGIIGIIEAIRAEQLVAMDVALNVAKIMFAGLTGFISAFVFIVPGGAMISK